MAPRLKTIAEAINAKVVGYTATVDSTFSSTDRKVGRLCIPGKGRRGFEIVILNTLGGVLFDYDTALHPYRSNKEAARCIAEIFGGEIWLPGVNPRPLHCWECRAVENARTRGKFARTHKVFGPVICPRCQL